MNPVSPSHPDRRANRVERMTLDVTLLRADTLGVANVLHFNNAGAALPPRLVLDAVTSHLARETAIGGYEAATEAEGRIADVYGAVAVLIGVRPRSICPHADWTRSSAPACTTTATSPSWSAWFGRWPARFSRYDPEVSSPRQR